MNEKVKFLENTIQILKDKYSNLKEESKQQIDYLSNKLSQEQEKNRVLLEKQVENEEKIKKLDEDLLKIIGINKNLLYETSNLTSNIERLMIERQEKQVEFEYIRSELTTYKRLYKIKEEENRKIDENYSKINMIMKEYQSTLVDMEVTNYYFKVTRVGNVIDTKADVRLYITIIYYTITYDTYDTYDTITYDYI